MENEMNQSEGNTLGIAGFILSLIGILFIFVWFYVGAFFGLIGLIFSAIQIKKSKNGLAIAGLILGIIVILIFIIDLFSLIFISEVIIPEIKEDLAIGEKCFSAITKISFESFCKNSDGVHIELSVLDENIAGVVFLIDGNQVEFENIGSQRDFLIDSSYGFDISDSNIIKLAPIIDGQTCDFSTPRTLIDC